MEKSKIEEMFAKMREEASNYIIKPISDKPAVPGEYTATIEGVRTIVPLIIKFDGENWVDLEQVAEFAEHDITKISYYEKKPAKTLKR